MGVAKMLLFRVLPPLIAVVTLVYILGFHIEFEDTALSGSVVSVDAAKSLVTLSVEDKRVTVPFEEVPAFTAPAGQFAANPGQAVGQTTSFIRHGLLHYLKGIPPWLAIVSFALTLVAILIQVFRMRALLPFAPMSYGVVLKGTLVGLFYGNVIPAGQVGGDPLKALYLANHGGAGKAEALAAVTIDRLTGLAVLALIAAVALMFTARNIDGPSAAVVLSLAGGLVFGLSLLLSRRIRKRLGVSWVGKRIPFQGPLRAFMDAFTVYKRAPKSIVKAAIFSLIAQVGLIGSVIAVGEGMEIANISVAHYALLVPIANIVGSLPGAPPGGWGVGEGAFILLFGAYGVPPEQAIALSVLPRVWILLISLTGFPFATFGRKKALVNSA
ncbi:MAG: flippase-like domain-containing protein [Planctomycetes bacterium]|nr:flippase-like domain-containing protein [Planctomycetota bacterium]